MVEQQLLSVIEASKVLGISERTTWHLIAARAFATVRIGKLRKVSKKELDKYIDEKTIPAKRPH